MEFSWLSPASRPSARDIETYALLINTLECHPPERLDESRREAELQLWIWRNERLARAPRNTRARQRRDNVPLHAAGDEM